MSPPILIVRLIPLEPLAAAIATCKAQWPESDIHVVTREVRAAELRDIEAIDLVIPIVVPAGGFQSFFNSPVEYAAVIFPVGNRSGLGYARTFLAFSQIQTGRFAVLPEGGKPRFFEAQALIKNARRELRWKGMCRPLGMMAAVGCEMLLCRKAPRLPEAGSRPHAVSIPAPHLEEEVAGADLQFPPPPEVGCKADGTLTPRKQRICTRETATPAG